MSFDDKEKVKFISNMQTWIESSIKTAPAGVRLKYASWLERVKQYKDGKIDFDTVLKELPQ
jgi:hypothetical protein